MSDELKGRRVAALVADGFEQVELFEPQDALEAAGAEVEIVSPVLGDYVKGWNHTRWGKKVPIDRPLAKASPDDFDALLLPGGIMNPDTLRTIPAAVEFVRKFFEDGKPIAVICHGPWTLVEADVVRGVRMTSCPSLKTDLVNAGAHWVDEEVVVDRGVVSSRRPSDMPAFIDRMIEEFSEGLNGGAGRREPADVGASG